MNINNSTENYKFDEISKTYFCMRCGASCVSLLGIEIHFRRTHPTLDRKFKNKQNRELRKLKDKEYHKNYKRMWNEKNKIDRNDKNAK